MTIPDLLDALRNATAEERRQLLRALTDLVRQGTAPDPPEGPVQIRTVKAPQAGGPERPRRKRLET